MGINFYFAEICNSFDYSWSNRPLEVTHTKIKTLKRNCFGMKNFKSFRKKVMLSYKQRLGKRGNLPKPLGVLFAMLIFSGFQLFWI